jgi:hypothetical protein
MKATMRLLPHSRSNGYHQKIKDKEVLARVEEIKGLHTAGGTVSW